MACSHWPGQRYDGQIGEVIFVVWQGDKRGQCARGAGDTGNRAVVQLKGESTEHGRDNRNAIILPDGRLKTVALLVAQPSNVGTLPNWAVEAQALRTQVEAFESQRRDRCRKEF